MGSQTSAAVTSYSREKAAPVLAGLRLRGDEMKQWGWVLQYGVGIVFALLLGAILRSFPLFKEAGVSGTKLKAAHVTRFLAYGGALVLLWMMARRAAFEMAEDAKGQVLVRHLLPPLVTLIVVSAGYKVLLLLIGPFLDRMVRTIYDWLFVIGIGGSTFWLIVAWFRHSAAFAEFLDRHHPTGPFCHDRRVTFTAGTKFCTQCGRRLIPFCQTGERSTTPRA